MQRNWELVRKLLLKLEEQDGASGWLEPSAVIGFEESSVAYHMRLLGEAGLIRFKSLGNLSAPDACVALSLTWDGHEFLDKIRKDTMWNKVKGIARSKGLDLSIDVIKLAAKLAIESMFESGT